MNEQVRHFAAAGDARAPFSASEFLRMTALGAFADMRAELVGGVIEKMMPAFMEHGESNGRLVARLIDAYRDSGFRVAVDLVVRIDEISVRAADIAVAHPNAPGRSAVSGDNLILAVEIADTTLARDLGDKLADYARAAIPEYWVVDVDARVVHVMRHPGDGGYRERAVVRFGETLAVPGTDAVIAVD